MIQNSRSISAPCVREFMRLTLLDLLQVHDYDTEEPTFFDVVAASYPGTSHTQA